MLNTVIRVNFIEKVTFKKRSGIGKRIALWVSERRTFQKERTVRYRPHSECVPGIFKKQQGSRCGWIGEWGGRSRRTEDNHWFGTSLVGFVRYSLQGLWLSSQMKWAAAGQF